MRLPLKRTLLALATLLAIGAAGTSIGANEVTSARYVCPDGERFSVEYRRTYARLRNSNGVFSLTADGSASSRRYSDGNLTLSPHDGGAILQHAGQDTQDDCLSETHRS
jgi:membrane-bound inhibitor of C-type lysozyme